MTQWPTRRLSEREPADSLRDKSNVIGGWLPSLTYIGSLNYSPMKKLVIAGSCLVLVWVAVSYAMMWPPLCSYAEHRSLDSCIGQLKYIEGSKEQFALETKRTNGPVSADELNKRYFKVAPVCPSGGIYTYGNLEDDPVCSLATNPAPPALKERVGLLGWRWRVRPSLGPDYHKLPR